jgi:hypothetical protein
LKRRSQSAIPIVLLALATLLPCAAAELNLYEWAEPAPTVISGEILGQVGKYTELKVERHFRGKPAPSSRLLIDLKYANRRRDGDVDPLKLRLLPGEHRIVLLHEDPARHSEGLPVYRLVRGVRGTRELPKEGAEAELLALKRFIQIQERRNEAATWELLAAMLEESNQVMLEAALGQHLKFRRGNRSQLVSLRPLLDYPAPAIREGASRLIGQIVARYGGEELPEEAELRGELVARARRDESVEVRIAATVALGFFEGEGVLEILQEIAAEDPEQEVRYEAETLLLSLREQADGAD